jgi:hypothetical protein
MGMQKVSFQGHKEFSAMGNVNKIYGWREKFPGISSWIVNPWQWNFLKGKLKQKGFFHSELMQRRQCIVPHG